MADDVKREGAIGDTPHLCNACGGNYHDWLEVLLTSTCNGSCDWCVERAGYHPEHIATWQEIATAAIETGRQNIILLGGEPTIYGYFREVIVMLSEAGRSVWTTTNGSILGSVRCLSSMSRLTGVNISIHHHNLRRNYEITGVRLHLDVLADSVSVLKRLGVKVRFNCNCIKGEIDDSSKALDYIEFARLMGADEVRMSELKNDADKFVSLAEMFDDQHGLNDDPFTNGCSRTATINGLPVSFRQMCGLQTPLRPHPENPKQTKNPVLYYDGNLYNGWQVAVPEVDAIDSILARVKDGSLDATEARALIAREKTTVVHSGHADGMGCVY